MKQENDDIKCQNEDLKTMLVKMKRELENICNEVKVLKNGTCTALLQ